MTFWYGHLAPPRCGTSGVYFFVYSLFSWLFFFFFFFSLEDLHAVLKAWLANHLAGGRRSGVGRGRKLEKAFVICTTVAMTCLDCYMHVKTRIGWRART